MKYENSAFAKEFLKESSTKRIKEARAVTYKEVHVKGNENSSGVNPFYFYKGSLDKGNVKLIFDCLEDRLVEKDIDIDQEGYVIPSASFKQKGDKWDVIFEGPVFDRSGKLVKVHKRTVKNIGKRSTYTLYGLMKCTHGGRDDPDSHWSGGNIAALKMVAHCQYPAGMASDELCSKLNSFFRYSHNHPSYYAYYGWTLSPSKVESYCELIDNY